MSETVQTEESIPAIAQLIGSGLAAGRNLDEIKARPKHIAAVTGKEVQDAARAIFVRNPAVTGSVIPGAAKR